LFQRLYVAVTDGGVIGRADAAGYWSAYISVSARSRRCSRLRVLWTCGEPRLSRYQLELSRNSYYSKSV